MLSTVPAFRIAIWPSSSSLKSSRGPPASRPEAWQSSRNHTGPSKASSLDISNLLEPYLRTESRKTSDTSERSRLSSTRSLIVRSGRVTGIPRSHITSSIVRRSFRYRTSSRRLLNLVGVAISHGIGLRSPTSRTYAAVAPYAATPSKRLMALISTVTRRRSSRTCSSSMQRRPPKLSVSYGYLWQLVKQAAYSVRLRRRNSKRPPSSPTALRQCPRPARLRLYG